MAEWEGRGRGGRGSDKAADCRESGHVSQPAPNKGNIAKCVDFFVPQITGGTELTPSPNTCVCAFVIFASQSRCEAEMGQQQTHKHGTGRCYALHPAQSAAAAACCYVYTRDDFFNYDFYSDVSYTLNLVTPWVCFSRCARANVTALFSLFEKAMLSASQNDITLRASYWPPRMKRPHLKTQSAVWMLLLGGGMRCSTDLMWRAS